MNRNPALKVPYSPSGNLLHHPGPVKVNPEGERTYAEVGEWRNNDLFEATLQLKGTERGRSAAFFRWEEVSAGRQFPMFITDMCHLIHLTPHFRAGGTINARWFVVKRGQNYGLTPQEIVVRRSGAGASVPASGGATAVL